MKLMEIRHRHITRQSVMNAIWLGHAHAVVARNIETRLRMRELVTTRYNKGRTGKRTACPPIRKAMTSCNRIER